MKSVIRHITVNCAPPLEPYTLAEFWSATLGHPIHPDDTPGDDEVLIELPDSPGLLFIRVPDPKSPTTRNRLHLDLQPEQPRDEEVTRLLTLGATFVDDQRTEDGRGWVVLADPAGNEFCVERSDAERTTP
ncbi:VOC family protein [Crossiella sp. SN42]|uniref:VOC family protein n=1 Tax=Crossiella sp. SN42 TaxID=2944808 RepID=UPI00207D5ED3|nr:VOC family protein [Crossiella sp. SN42]MCO1579796.1 VOC family protein [Crossiella sp. SN42]